MWSELGCGRWCAGCHGGLERKASSCAAGRGVVGGWDDDVAGLTQEDGMLAQRTGVQAYRESV